MTTINNVTTSSPRLKVGIIGGGIAGSTIALRLASLGIRTYLFERNASLVSAPPMCHLHAGGNLYREIPDKDCLTLLQQAIDMIRLYPHSIDVRPTVIAIPKRDSGSPLALLPRLQLLTQRYQQLVDLDPSNQVLGKPEQYYQLFERAELEALARQPAIAKPKTLEQWIANASRYLDLDTLKFPIIAVQEYGWNIFRLSASTQLALSSEQSVTVLTNTVVTTVKPIQPITSDNRASMKQWEIHYQTQQQKETAPNQNTHSMSVNVDYLINACGFQTGEIDDMVGIHTERMVEFKASYIAQWQEADGALPEIIIHGQRGTPQGMAQLTPYPNGYYQIHAMSDDITLFADGLVKSTINSAQPQLNPTYLHYIQHGWDKQALLNRSQKAIQFVSEFVPKFAQALPANHALYGGQQIPGEDDTLRVADIRSYRNQHYIRAENVKASSTLTVADEVIKELQALGLLNIDRLDDTIRQHHQWRYLQHHNKADIDILATVVAKQRKFPEAMAQVITPIHTTTHNL
ncbi:FAD-dependent oxidoreductase [Psychrobacter sp. I-STPA6b]|uniref:FAD-dependent oxidoreductase n=1 Tax=Psychrobacter sp. I-STPA6b TaxID=2585718 RepID=UPI001D0C7A7A|nr:FAD-dependent oxidoreductase [Psychrobacter sp. I-STPA6b]